MNLVYLPEARLDVLAAVTYYDDCEGGEGTLARDFYKELKRAENDIIEMPDFWHPVSKDYRRKWIRRFPFGIIYHKIDNQIIEVVAVAHQKRQPNCWKKQ